MEQWMWFVIIPLSLLLIYAIFFYLASMLQQGSLLRIRLSYFASSIREKLSTLTSRPKAAPSMPIPPSEIRSPASPTMPSIPQPVSLKPAPPKPVAPKPAPLKPAIVKEAVKKEAVKPEVRPSMTVPTTEPLSFQVAKQAAEERQRIWIKYRDEDHRETEEKIEIYRATIGGGLWVWCCLKRTRSTLRRNQIIAWRLLNERFERTPYLEQWARWGELSYLPSWLSKIFQK